MKYDVRFHWIYQESLNAAWLFPNSSCWILIISLWSLILHWNPFLLTAPLTSDSQLNQRSWFIWFPHIMKWLTNSINGSNIFFSNEWNWLPIPKFPCNQYWWKQNMYMGSELYLELHQIPFNCSHALVEWMDIKNEIWC